MFLKPKPPFLLGFVSLSQENQHIFFLPMLEFYQKRVTADWIILYMFIGNMKQVIANEGIAEKIILSIK